MKVSSDSPRGNGPLSSGSVRSNQVCHRVLDQCIVIFTHFCFVYFYIFICYLFRFPAVFSLVLLHHLSYGEVSEL